jgi:hypothetical protein
LKAKGGIFAFHHSISQYDVTISNALFNNITMQYAFDFTLKPKDVATVPEVVTIFQAIQASDVVGENNMVLTISNSKLQYVF